MKRVLIFSLAYHPHVGGAEVALKEITDRIDDIEFHMLTMRFGNEAREERFGNVFVHRLGNGRGYLSKILFVPRAALRARVLHRAHRFDAFWAMMSYMLFPIVLLRFVGVRVSYLFTLQEGDPFSRTFARWFILPFRPLLRHGFRYASAVTAISTYLAHWGSEMGYRGTVHVIPNGVDINLFSRPVEEEGKRLLRGSMLLPGGTLLITTSRLVKKNSIDTIIRSLALLPPSIKLLVIGSGPDFDELDELTHDLEVEGRVTFLGYKDLSSVPFYLQGADIFIRPSRSEGMGNSFVEAMAAGLPVIATQEGGIADFLFDEKRNPDKPTTGWAVDKDSPEQIAGAVRDILARPDQVARVTANALALVREKYDWNLIARQMKTVFDTVTP